MRVEPELFDHPKFIRLKRRAGEYALEGLERVWGHCQSAQRGERWPGADAEYVEMVARWQGPAGEFFKALQDSGWVKVEDGVIVIRGWLERNQTIARCWEIGKMGGRPGNNHKVTSGLAHGNPALTSSTDLVRLGTGLVRSGEVRNNIGDKKGASPVQEPGVPAGAGKGEVGSGSRVVEETATRALEARVKRSKMQYAAMMGRITELRSITDLTDEQRGELRGLEVALDKLQRRQAAGDF